MLSQDWSDAWETLPDAPPLVSRPSTAQITLRLPSSLLARVKRIAGARSLPYHALARSWLVDGLRESTVPDASATDEPQTEQFNIKLSQNVLDGLKARAAELQRPYHRLAREWVEAAVLKEETHLGLDAVPADQPGIKDLMVLLLHSNDTHSPDAIRGITRLQKLLFVIEQKLMKRASGFYAFNYGPFNEGVNDAAQALRLAGFVRGSEPAATGPPSFDEMMATATDHSGPREQPEVEEFALSETGHEAAERLRQSGRAYDQLFVAIDQLRDEWDTPDLVERVYEAWPEYTERSVIRDEVAVRWARRRTR